VATIAKSLKLAGKDNTNEGFTRSVKERMGFSCWYSKDLLAFAVKFQFIVRMMTYSNFCISRKQAGRMTEPWPFFTLGASHCGEVVCSFSMVPEMQSCQ